MLVALLFAGVVFYEAFFALNTLASVELMRETAFKSLAVVKSSDLSDEQKAEAMQRSGIAMSGAVCLIFLKMSAATAAAAALLFAVSLFAWPFENLVEYSMKPFPLIATICVLIAYGKLRHGRREN